MYRVNQAQVRDVKARGAGLGGALWRCSPEQLPTPRATASKNCRRSLTDLIGGACRSCSEAARRGVVGATIGCDSCSVLRAKPPPLLDKFSNNALRSLTGIYFATTS